MAFVEKTGKSVDEAVAAALAELNVTADQAVVEVLEEAKRLLVTTTYSMNEIAVILKYKSNTHFGADFKRSTGMTPVEYRKNIRAEREKQIQAENHQMNLEEYLAKTC